MARYTSVPPPIVEARQINNQEDGDAWAASLTANELVNGGVSITDVRIEIDGDRFWLKFTRTDEADGAAPYAMDQEIGGYAIAIASGASVNLWPEMESHFLNRYAPYEPTTP